MGIWRVVTGNQTLALRLFGPDDAVVRAWEQSAMELAADAGIPVPVVHHTGSFETYPYLVTDWLPGVRVADALRSSPHRSRDIGRIFGKLQAELHAIRAAGELRRNWIDWPVAGPARVRDRLMKLHLCEDALLHLDYHPENVLTDGRRITAVLDWTNVHAGDPRADLARTYVIMTVLPGISRPLRAALALPRRRFLRGWWEGYSEVAGQVDDMPVFYAWAGHALAGDISRKRGHPETGFTDEIVDAEVARILRHTARWEREAGLI